ncbi:hypothetical protein [Oceanobacillus senegalensis]|uniref:hypothetical protein n=1 Tax=Oceanobacillus senegalensis TaxID=1936063 RepID=UPI000A3144BB|nr:hypothetical protein [Oceanobacillus senegalensis]
MESIKKQKKESKTTDSILIALVIILLLKNTIDLFFFDLFPTVADNIFWAILSVIFVIVFYIKKSYIFLTITLVILIAGFIQTLV